jgi:hypothetical protein
VRDGNQHSGVISIKGGAYWVWFKEAWPLQAGDHANQRLSVLLSMRELRDNPAPEAGRLLRVLFIRDGEVPADAVSWMLWVGTLRFLIAR